VKYNILILAEAEIDIENAFVWYELNQIGLGKKFFESVNKSIHFIAGRPFICSEIFKNIRRFVIKKFPYGIYYRVNSESKEVQIIAIIHFKRSIRVLKKRIK